MGSNTMASPLLRESLSFFIQIFILAALDLLAPSIHGGVNR